MSNWVLIADVDICPYSKQQLDSIKESDMKLQGAILCNEEQNKDSKTAKPLRKPAKKASKNSIDASKEKKETNTPEKVTSGSANNSDEKAS